MRMIKTQLVFVSRVNDFVVFCKYSLHFSVYICDSHNFLHSIENNNFINLIKLWKRIKKKYLSK